MTRPPRDQRIIFWDFDGTLYPLCPFDSEQILLRLHAGQLEGICRLPRKLITRGVVHADQRQWLGSNHMRKLYRQVYAWCLKGIPTPLLENAADAVAASISPRDRTALGRLHDAGWRMVVISCGTLDLCEGVLIKAGIRGCFESVHANPLKIRNGIITGSVSKMTTAEDKLRLAKMIAGGRPHGVVAVGDGYTDIPLMDWCQLSLMMDPNGCKKPSYAGKSYRFVASIHAAYKLLTDPVGRSMGCNRY